MPTKSLQLDGPDLEELLARAMTEAGPGGRVASADRVRRGGVAGFFARQHFEVVVEFDEDPRHESRVEAARPRERDSAPTEELPTVAPARTWSELADVTEDVLELSAQAPAPAMSTATPAVTPTTTPTPTPAADPGPDTARAPAPALGSETRLPSTQKSSFAAMLSAIARDTLAESEDSTGRHAAKPAASAGAPGEATAPELTIVPAPSSSEGTRAWIDAVAAATQEFVPADAPSAPIVAADLFETAERAGSGHVMSPRDVVSDDAVVQPALAALGLPVHLLPEHAVLSCLEDLSISSDAQSYVEVALTSALQQLPQAPLPPQRPGSILVIVGELDRALGCAAALADRAGIDLDTIVVASQARHRRGIGASTNVANPEEALELAARGRRLPHPLIVAMHSPVSAEPDRWATRMLAALAPVVVWGVAAATHKSEDLAAWAEGIGGIDALALEDLGTTTSPADVLGAGIPVASLDGQHATPALWAALIAARLLLTRSVAVEKG